MFDINVKIMAHPLARWPHRRAGGILQHHFRELLVKYLLEKDGKGRNILKFVLVYNAYMIQPWIIPFSDFLFDSVFADGGDLAAITTEANVWLRAFW